MNYKTLIVIVYIFLSGTVYSQDENSSAKKDSSEKVISTENGENNTVSYQLTVDSDLLKSIEETIKGKTEKSFLNKYGTLIVAVVALLGTVLTTFIGTNRSKKNLEKQLVSTEKNLMAQITANNKLEKDKKEIEQKYEKINTLKEAVAKFIQKATLLNLKLNTAIYYHLEEGRNTEAQDEYDDTIILRNELKSIYYSIKVTLDGSAKQKEIEKVIDKYMNTTCFSFDLQTAKADEYEQPIGKLYHKIKAVVHDNYTEPV